jgi:sialidase-1
MTNSVNRSEREKTHRNRVLFSILLGVIWGTLSAVTACSGLAAEVKPLLEQQNVYVGGVDGYHTYRIPAMVVTTKGTVLAFCEGRKDSLEDTGNIDLLLKRSLDNGHTWSAQQIVYEEGGDRQKITIGNPCPVVDRETGKIWLPFCRNNTRVSVTFSDDDGRSWATPREITNDVKKPDWKWYATGPGNGIQLRHGSHRGRLVIPCDHADHWRWPKQKGRPYYSHVFFSDDHGRSWQLGGSCGPMSDECAIVELDDGKLLLNMRNWGNACHRAVATSEDGGLSWSAIRHDAALPEPQCEASLIRLPGDDGRVLFSNPASTTDRIKMTVRLSKDGGRTWTASRCLHNGPAAYSSLAVAKDGTMLCLYESGRKHRYEHLRLARFNLAWLEQRR